jgi:glucose/arabinose dehydrogenase
MKKIKSFLIVITILLLFGLLYYFTQSKNEQPVEDKREVTSYQDYEIQTVVDGLERPWDVKVDNEGEIFFTQRQSGLYKYTDKVEEVYIPEDLYNAGEGGMLGFDLAPDFSTSREIYVCFNSGNILSGVNVFVSRLTLDESLKNVIDREDIITDIPSATSGRHSGCRVLFDRNDDDIVWVTTGDTADEDTPQNPQSLGGKVLRVDRNGNGVDGNLLEPFDDRIFSYGHRNVQGITLFPEFNETLGYGLISEHGPSIDDEINQLTSGNYGWHPGKNYNESVPMTDLEKYPQAIEALWSSGDRTIAACGIEYIDNGMWEGDVLLAALKDSYILRYTIEGDIFVKQEEVINDYGRIRQVYESQDGRVFFTTDNGSQDIIGEIVFE